MSERNDDELIPVYLSPEDYAKLNKVVRLNARMPTYLHRQMVKACEDTGVTMTEFVINAVTRRLNALNYLAPKPPKRRAFSGGKKLTGGLFE